MCALVTGVQTCALPMAARRTQHRPLSDRRGDLYRAGGCGAPDARADGRGARVNGSLPILPGTGRGTMRSMVEGHVRDLLPYLSRITPRLPTPHPSGGPPPRPGVATSLTRRGPQILS